MSGNKADPAESIQSIEIDESDVAGFLRTNPDFFQRHAHLLVDLVIPHSTSGRTLSLLEKQVAVLREQQTSFQQRMSELMDSAVANEKLLDRLNELFVWLAGASEYDDMISRVPDWLERRFDLSAVRLEMFGEDRDAWQDVQARMQGGRSVCDDRLPSTLLQQVFGESADDVASAALVPLMAPRSRTSSGFLALGASEANRYLPTTDTRFIDYLGQMIAVTAARLRNTA